MEERSNHKFTSCILVLTSGSFLFATTSLHILVAVIKYYTDATIVTLGTFLATYILIAMWLLLYYFQQRFWAQVKLVCLLPMCCHILSTFLASVMAHIEKDYTTLVIIQCVFSWLSPFSVFFTVVLGLNHVLPYLSNSEPVQV